MYLEPGQQVPITLPTYPTYPGSGEAIPGGGGGGGKKATVSWKSYSIAGAPQWWRGKVPSSFNAKTAYAAVANAIMPYLSPEDQRTVAANLAMNFQGQFGGYNPQTGVQFSKPPGEMTSAIRGTFSSAERAQGILSSLEKMQKTSKAKPGAGMKFLQQVATIMRDYGGKGGDFQTRRQQMQMMAALDPLVQGANQGSTAPYVNLANMMAKPYFTAGNVIPVSKDQSGKWVFGQYNPDLA